MKNIEKKVAEVIQKEEQKFDKELKKIDLLSKDIDKLDITKKSTYTLPPVDTIGKTYYNTLNCNNV